MIAFVFRPKVIHLGVQCADYCALGTNDPGYESEARLDFSAKCAAHQQQCGLGASLENPWVSDVWRHHALREHLDIYGQGSPWTLTRSAGCQCGMCFPGTHRDIDNIPLEGRAIEKGRGWLNNFGLALLSNQRGRPDSLCNTAHEHYHARGNYVDPVDGKSWKLSKFTARYTDEEAASYAACVSRAVDERLERSPRKMETDAQLRKLAMRSRWHRELQGKPPREVGVDVTDQGPDGSTNRAWSSKATRGSPSSSAGDRLGPIAGGDVPSSSAGTRPESTEEGGEPQPDVEDDSPHRKIGLLELAAEKGGDFEDEQPWHICADGLGAAQLRGGTGQIPAPGWSHPEEKELPQRSLAEEQEDRRLHKEEQKKWNKIWMDWARARDWSYPEVPVEAYRFSGATEDFTEDPCKKSEYIADVLAALGLQPGAPPYECLAEDDMNAVREVVRRKASVFWIEDSPRTTLLHLQHDAKPTGPPVRTPPHNLKAEEADVVDEQLGKEVLAGTVGTWKQSLGFAAALH